MDKERKTPWIKKNMHIVVLGGVLAGISTAGVIKDHVDPQTCYNFTGEYAPTILDVVNDQNFTITGERCVKKGTVFEGPICPPDESELVGFIDAMGIYKQGKLIPGTCKVTKK